MVQRREDAYRLSLASYDESVHACELDLDRLAVRFDPECPLEVWDSVRVNLIYIGRGICVGHAPLWASPRLLRAVRACALRKNAFTFLLDRLRAVVLSRSASSFLFPCAEW